MEYASEDLDAAQQLLAGGTCFNLAGFHCQQTIEKSLKAYLPCKYNSQFNRFIGETALLNRYYIECRYPSDNWENPDRKMIQRNLCVTRDLYVYVCKLIYKNDYESEKYKDN